MHRALALAGLPVALLLGGCSLDAGANSIIREVQSPGGQMKAVVFDRNSGATAGFSTQVSLLSAQQALPNESGNIFVADTDHGAAPSAPNGGPVVSVAWLSPTSLKIAYDQHARTFNKQALYQGVSIRYEAK